MAEQYIALIRHGDYQQRPNTPSALQMGGLTDAGLQQAQACAALVQARLDQFGWDLAPKVHCSSSRRAWQTAMLCCQQLACSFELQQSDALCERSVGAAANLSSEDIEQLIAADERFDSLPAGWKSDSHFRLPVAGAESLIEAGQRVAAYLRAALPAPTAPAQLHLFFGHGASFRHAAHELGILSLEQVQALSMHHAQPVILMRNPDGKFEHHSGDWKLRTSPAKD